MKEQPNLKQKLITDYFSKNKSNNDSNPNQIIPKIYGYNESNGHWHCTECGEDMGPNNPRQLCGKNRCYNW